MLLKDHGMPKKPKASAQKQKRYRNRLHLRGLRPVQIWAQDTRAPGFAAECRRQARLIARASREEKDALSFIENAFDWPE